MFELPELVTLARQINETLPGKTIRRGTLGNSPHKFVWYNRTPEEFEMLTDERVIGTTRTRGKWLFLPLNPLYVLLLGDCGGKLLYHAPGAKLPTRYHLHLAFDDDSHLTVTTQMWGFMELYEQGRECEHHYLAKGSRPTPLEAEFTPDYFAKLVGEVAATKAYSVKGLLTRDQLVPGLSNALAQDILFKARLHPRYLLAKLDAEQTATFYHAIQSTVSEVIAQGGRYDEVDLFGNPGGYVRLMDSNSAGLPCPVCGTKIAKMSYLGGMCYYCPTCQKL